MFSQSLSYVFSHLELILQCVSSYCLNFDWKQIRDACVAQMYTAFRQTTLVFVHSVVNQFCIR